uniref:Essential MCU regulator, mitochondrial n=1 Tax=Caenorhabditis tropicalis TaxID=1561998 RepID=A0A1I7TI98_9PELO
MFYRILGDVLTIGTFTIGATMYLNSTLYSMSNEELAEFERNLRINDEDEEDEVVVPQPKPVVVDEDDD